MYFKEYGKEFKIRNHVNIYVYLTTTSLFLILYNLKIAEEKINEKVLKLIRYISKNTLVIYLLASITDMMVYARLKEIFPDVTTRLRYAVPVSILIFTLTIVMSYIYNLILKGVKQAIIGKKVEEIQ